MAENVVVKPCSLPTNRIELKRRCDRLGARKPVGVTRPAFNNEVEYDLAQSNVLSYKGARVEVLDASPESITFRVLSHFD